MDDYKRLYYMYRKDIKVNLNFFLKISSKIMSIKRLIPSHMNYLKNLDKEVHGSKEGSFSDILYD